MRRVLLLTLVSVAAILVVALTLRVTMAGEISPRLQSQLEGQAKSSGTDVDAQNREEAAIHKILVTLVDQVDIVALDGELHEARAPLAERHRIVIEALRSMAARTQAPLIAELESMRGDGRVAGYTSHWIVNGIVVGASVEAIHEIAARDDVDLVDADLEIAALSELSETAPPLEIAGSDALTKQGRDGDPGVTADTAKGGYGLSPALTLIEADRVWTELGIDGSGAIVGTIDTGADLTHPAIAARWQGNVAPAEESWYDVIGAGFPVPMDVHYQGTAVVSIMCGIAPGDTTGVAPGSRWIATNLLGIPTGDTFDNAFLASLEFMADPDGDATTVDDMADVVVCAWGVNDSYVGYANCDTRWYDAMDACEAAGVALVFAVGDDGPDKNSIRSPADRGTTPYNSFSVGATNLSASPVVSSFSSLGPSNCGGPHATKPEVVAPGEEVFIAYADDYALYQTTVASTSIVGGIVALMRSANPDLDVISIKEILMNTAVDIGLPGEDNAAGHGTINAYDAVVAAMGNRGTVTGTVTDSNTGRLLGGAQVSFGSVPYVVNTDANGVYRASPEVGSYTLDIAAMGYESVSVNVDVLEATTTTVDVALIPLPQNRLYGTVYDAGGLPLAGATVQALNSSFPAVASNPDGSYELWLPSGPSYTINARVSGHGGVEGEVILSGDVQQDLQLSGVLAEGFDTGNFLNYPWHREGFALWSVDAGTVYDGTHAARSPAVSDGQYGFMTVSVDVLATSELRFAVKTSTEPVNDVLVFYIDGVMRGTWHGEMDWTEVSYEVGAGSHEFTWTYGKNGSVSSGQDAAWVDMISWPASAAPVHPNAGISTAAIDVRVAPDGQVGEAIVLSNTGIADLSFAGEITIHHPLVPEGTTPPKDAPVHEFFGPDPQNYYAFDHTQPGGPVYDWIEIRDVGTALPPTISANYGPFELGFPFSWYGVDYTEIRISTNGWLSFNSHYDYPQNETLPDPSVPNDIIAGFWDALSSQHGGAIYYHQDTANGRFIVEWDAVPRYWYGSARAPETFQIILHDDDTIVFQYKDVDEVDSSTIGFEDPTGEFGLMLAHNENYVQNGMAIRIQQLTPWVVATGLSGTLATDESANIDLGFDAAGLSDGTYRATLSIETNDPLADTIEVPLDLVVAEGTAVGEIVTARSTWLRHAYPNPFNPATTIEFEIPAGGAVGSLKIYDVAGRMVKTLASGRLDAGTHEVIWRGADESGRRVASGTYFYRLTTGSHTETRSMVLMK